MLTNSHCSKIKTIAHELFNAIESRSVFRITATEIIVATKQLPNIHQLSHSVVTAFIALFFPSQKNLPFDPFQKLAPDQTLTIYDLFIDFSKKLLPILWTRISGRFYFSNSENKIFFSSLPSVEIDCDESESGGSDQDLSNCFSAFKTNIFS